jgi:peroxiredoxin
MTPIFIHGQLKKGKAMSGKWLSRSVLILSLFLCCLFAAAQEDGKQWIGRVARAYGELTSYHFEGVIRSETTGFQNATRSSSFVRDAKPKENKFRYQAGIADSKFVASCNGVSTAIYFGGSRQYVIKRSADFGAILNDIFKGESAPYLGAALPSEYALLESKCSSIRFLRREPVSLQSTRIDCIVVEVEIAPDKSFPATRTVRTLWIDPEKLIVVRDVIHTQTYSTKNKLLCDAVDEMKLSSFQINDPIADSVFQFEPSFGARIVDALNLPDSGNGLAMGPSIENIPLVDLNGARYSFKGMRGSAILLDFWSTSCVPCWKEMADLEKIHLRYKDKGLAIFGVNQEQEQLQIKFLKKKSFSYSMLSDRGGMLTRQFSAAELPVLVLIDKQGRIVEWGKGLQKQEELERLLGFLGIQ